MVQIGPGKRRISWLQNLRIGMDKAPQNYFEQKQSHYFQYDCQHPKQINT